MAEAETVERRHEAQEKAGEALYWQQQLDLSDRDHQDFIKAGRAVQERYKGEKLATAKAGRKRFNILFSNTETLKGATLAKMAKPDVRRRFSDQDPIGKAVAEVVERGLIYCDDSYDAEAEFEAGLEDYLLPGRGVAWVVYEATTDEKVVTNQELYVDHVYWEDFRHQPARRWKNIEWVARRHKMSRDALISNFKEMGEKAPLNWSPEAEGKDVPDAFKRAEVWEIWDREKRQRVWIVKGFKDVLRRDDDPYGLEDFFPLAEPLQAITTTSTFIPQPEFHIYQDQADGLDEIEDRIDRLTRALKRRGVYDATFKELERLSRAGDNQFIAVKNYADLSTKGGLAAAFQTEDLSAIAKVLAELHAQRDLRVQTIYEVIGIADIMRGATDPRETLGAQQMKAQFGGNRLKKRIARIQKWIRDTLRLKAEIIAEHFQPEKLAEMTGIPLNPAAIQAPQPTPPPEPTGDQEQDQQAQQEHQAQEQQAQQQYQEQVQKAQQIIEVLRSDRLRSYRIDIETDSTIFEDAESEKAATVELLTSMSAFLEKGLAAGQMAPEMTPLIFEMIALGLRAFKTGRSLEDTLEQVKNQMMEKAANPQPQQDPKLEAEKVKAEAVKQKTEMDMQAAEQKQRMAMEAAQQKQALEQQKMQMEMQKLQAQLQFMMQKLGIERQKMQMEAEAGQQEMAMEQAANQQRTAMDRDSMELERERSEREHELGSEAMEQKHTMGLEMMAHKAKQAKKPEARR